MIVGPLLLLAVFGLFCFLIGVIVGRLSDKPMPWD